jgi:hypothetical protein
MLRLGSSMKFEECPHRAGRKPGAALMLRTPLEEVGGSRDEMLALEAQQKRMQALVGELLLKNQELRLEVERLEEKMRGNRIGAGEGHEKGGGEGEGGQFRRN